MTIIELQKFSVSDLQRSLTDTRRELYEMSLSLVAGVSKESHKKGACKKNIARILTVLNEKTS
ncbi:50S ribosomal protein L29 [Candidatus Peregrinibacteria bacterium]|nr:MAG: 50S ribosomal protein L29 [Candidatus Peregrinibacteria bacterium]